ncbi:hypothetical protein THIX_10706 [Thiomonas sp. X19]|nr:hypothetical protein THIX_10706 [Thiomonas sp. X19]
MPRSRFMCNLATRLRWSWRRRRWCGCRRSGRMSPWECSSPSSTSAGCITTTMAAAGTAGRITAGRGTACPARHRNCAASTTATGAATRSRRASMAATRIGAISARLATRNSDHTGRRKAMALDVARSMGLNKVALGRAMDRTTNKTTAAATAMAVVRIAARVDLARVAQVTENQALRAANPAHGSRQDARGWSALGATETDLQTAHIDGTKTGARLTLPETSPRGKPSLRPGTFPRVPGRFFPVCRQELDWIVTVKT